MASQELEFGNGENTLGKDNGETLEAEQLQHLAEMVYMGVEIRTEDQDILDIDKTKRKVTKDLIHHPLEGVPGIPESKRKVEELKYTEQHNDCCSLDVVSYMATG